MHRQFFCLAVVLVMVGWSLSLCAQQQASETFPSTVKFSGTLIGFDGKPLRGAVGVNFYLYSEKDGGAPLWMEAQNVHADSNGHYSVMLGSAKNQGLPADVFAGGGARWLSVQPSGEAEQGRTLLFSLPYGGPVVASPQAIQPLPEALGPRPQQAQKLPPTVHGNGVVNFIPLWTDTKIIGESVLSQSGGNVGVGTTTPATNLDVFSSTQGIHAPIAQFGSAGTTDSNSILTYNGTGRTEMFQSGCANCFAPGAQAGDGGIRVGQGKSIFLGDSGATRLRLDGAGNAFQPRTAGGMVKAMVSYIGASDTIDRCFNSTLSGTAATKPPCGFSKDKTGLGDYVFDFGFEVDDRFYSISQIGFQPTVDTLLVCHGTNSCTHTLTPNQLDVTTRQGSGFADSAFTLIVY